MALLDALGVSLVTLFVVAVVFVVLPAFRKAIDGDPVPDRPLRDKEDQPEE